MERIVHIVSDPDDGDVAKELVKYLQNADFVVHHNGKVEIGDSIIARATDQLSRGTPVVICATSLALGRKWTHQLANSANTMPRSRVFLIRMEEKAYVEPLSLNNVIAEYWKAPQAALSDLCEALNRCYPQIESPTLNYQSPAQPVDHLDTLTGLTIFDMGMSALNEFREKLRDDVRKRLPDTFPHGNFFNKPILCVMENSLASVLYSSLRTLPRFYLWQSFNASGTTGQQGTCPETRLTLLAQYPDKY